MPSKDQIADLGDLKCNEGCRNKCNLGYAFVNFTSVEATRRLYKAFHAQQWEAFNSRKICQVTYARVQVCSYLFWLFSLNGIFELAESCLVLFHLCS
jgi:hypothetical protein